MRLTVSSDLDHGIGVVVVSGEIDLATVTPLRQAISDHIAAGTTLLLLDMTAVTFIDSTGLGLLVGAGKKARGMGGSMRVVCDNPRVLRLLTITGLARALAVHPTYEDAVADWDADPTPAAV